MQCKKKTEPRLSLIDRKVFTIHDFFNFVSFAHPICIAYSVASYGLGVYSFASGEEYGVLILERNVPQGILFSIWILKPFASSDPFNCKINFRPHTFILEAPMS